MPQTNNNIDEKGFSAFYSEDISNASIISPSSERKRKVNETYDQHEEQKQKMSKYESIDESNSGHQMTQVVADTIRVNFVNFPHMNSYWTEVCDYLAFTEIKDVETLVTVLRYVQSVVYGENRKGFDQFQIKDDNNLTYLLGSECGQLWKGRNKFYETLAFIKQLVLDSRTILGPSAKTEYYTHASQKHSTIQENGGMLPILGDLNQSRIEVDSKCVKLSKLECACIMANSFFGTFSRMGDTRDGPYLFMPSINFDSLINDRHESSASKLLMIIHYFERLCERGFEELATMGYVHFIRKRVDPQDVESLLSSCTDNVSQVSIYPEGSIEDCPEALHADFANMYIGGGVLRAGNAQEEIRFVSSPETIVSRLFIERMADNESILIIGTEQFSKHEGYAKSLLYAGDYVDSNYESLFDGNLKSFKSQIVAFDSKFYTRHNLLEQWQIEHIDREIIKAYSAFCDIEEGMYDGLHIYGKISTGHWGCGAFLCDKELKFVIQLIAASIAKKPLHYFTFGEKRISESMKDFLRFVQENNFTIADVYEVLLGINDGYVKERKNDRGFYPKTLEYLKSSLSKNCK